MATIEQDLIGLQTAMPQPSILVSESASERLLAMMREKDLDGYALRVFVSGGGCSGLQYGMTFDDEMREGDNEFFSGALRVVVDPISSGYLTGASIDFVDSLMGGGFKIDNPNAVSSCGCGHSFRTASDGDDEGAPAGGGCGTCGAS
ncbi:iron-sulfur cluster assembly accessory protein [Oscillochloris sp. ZM17-4]|uniref:HesB/IscA family protein n=1 Tax=Oscillochloris sp. ZM17-4 TaxID=2866714 RepID=UPI001C73136D|nr:iron-sulfur cluster assembly accessory protein [Oscillochloris sp. ZM17-4]MBX0330807.1 iron-sulfur cluster assembly accessory protein [Oscillochloris sp. ZM17-4]